MPAIHPPPFSPPPKKLKLPQHPDFPLNEQIPIPAFFGHQLIGSSKPFSCVPENTPVGMQGARHAHYGLSLSDLHRSMLRSGLIPFGSQPNSQAIVTTGGLIPFGSQPNSQVIVTRGASNPIISKPCSDENDSCLLTMGNSIQGSKKSDNGKEAAQFVLFGQPILTEKQISLSCSSDTVSPVCTGNSSSNGNTDKMGKTSVGSGSALNQNDAPEHSSCEEGFQSDPSSETGHCKVFLESEDIGRTLDLSSLGSYEELYKKLEIMFGIETSEMVNHILYQDAITGAVKQLGNEPFSDFMKTARRLTIPADSSGDNVGG